MISRRDISKLSLFTVTAVTLLALSYFADSEGRGSVSGEGAIAFVSNQVAAAR